MLSIKIKTFNDYKVNYLNNNLSYKDPIFYLLYAL